MLNIKRFVFNPIQENTYIVVDSGKCAVIDPGMSDERECAAISSFIEENKLELSEVICTHLHIDHAWGAAFLREKYGVRPKANDRDARLGQLLAQQIYAFGLPGSCDAFTDFTNIDDGDTLLIGSATLSVLAVPGHSPGGLSLYCESEELAFVGDSIFRGSIGRSDIYGGDHNTLVAAVKSKLLSLPPDTILLPGHGEPTSVDEELKFNPFVR